MTINCPVTCILITTDQNRNWLPISNRRYRGVEGGQIQLPHRLPCVCIDSGVRWSPRLSLSVVVVVAVAVPANDRECRQTSRLHICRCVCVCVCCVCVCFMSGVCMYVYLSTYVSIYTGTRYSALYIYTRRTRHTYGAAWAVYIYTPSVPNVPAYVCVLYMLWCGRLYLLCCVCYIDMNKYTHTGLYTPNTKLMLLSVCVCLCVSWCVSVCVDTYESVCETFIQPAA